MELVTACLWTLLYQQVATNSPLSWIDFVIQALVVSVLVALVFIDLDHFIAPDELNIFIAGLAFGRAVALIGLAYFIGADAWLETSKRLLYSGWLPLAAMGALAYAGVLFSLSVITYIVYARQENESVLACLVRYFKFEEEETVPSVSSAVASDGPAPEALAATDQLAVEPGAQPSEDPPRLAMSPAFLTAISAILLFPLIGYVAVAVFVVPALLFVMISAEPEQSIVKTVQRFFRSADLGPPTSVDHLAKLAQEDATTFAKEAETGQHGGMGLGDVKLAIGLGALLGPGLAILSLAFATCIGAVTGVAMAAKHGRSLKLSLPFVPFMAAGAILTMLYGTPLVGWYLNILYPQPAPTKSVGDLVRERKAMERRIKYLENIPGAGRPTR